MAAFDTDDARLSINPTHEYRTSLDCGDAQWSDLDLFARHFGRCFFGDWSRGYLSLTPEGGKDYQPSGSTEPVSRLPK